MPLNRVLEAALELQEFCVDHGYRWCFIGGLAVQRWGEPRVTRDADLTLLTGFGLEEKFVDALLGKFAARRPGAREFALQSRVVLLQASNRVPLDIALGALPFEERTISRASGWQLPAGKSLITCCAEDLLVHKAFAAREQDWLDIRGILIRQHARLDLGQVRAELKPLVDLKEQPEILSRLEALIERCLGEPR